MTGEQKSYTDAQIISGFEKTQAMLKGTENRTLEARQIVRNVDSTERNGRNGYSNTAELINPYEESQPPDAVVKIYEVLANGGAVYTRHLDNYAGPNDKPDDILNFLYFRRVMSEPTTAGTSLYLHGRELAEDPTPLMTKIGSVHSLQREPLQITGILNRSDLIATPYLHLRESLDGLSNSKQIYRYKIRDGFPYHALTRYRPLRSDGPEDPDDVLNDKTAGLFINKLKQKPMTEEQIKSARGITSGLADRYIEKLSDSGLAARFELDDGSNLIALSAERPDLMDSGLRQGLLLGYVATRKFEDKKEDPVDPDEFKDEYGIDSKTIASDMRRLSRIGLISSSHSLELGTEKPGVTGERGQPLEPKTITERQQIRIKIVLNAAGLYPREIIEEMAYRLIDSEILEP